VYDMEEACSTLGRDEKRVQNSGLKIRREEDHLEDVGVQVTLVHGHGIF
jgi:hypothetical protein